MQSPEGVVVMALFRKLVYISGALSDLPDELRTQYLEFYEAIGDVVRDLGLEPYIPHQNTDPVRHKDVTPPQVDTIDRTAVTSSVLVIAVADNASSGVGIEVEMANHSSKPVVLICDTKRLVLRRISRLIRGNPAVVHEIRYSGQDDALAQLRTFILSWLQQQENSILPASLKE